MFGRGRDKNTEMRQLPSNPVSKNNALESLDLSIPARNARAITQTWHNAILSIDVANNLHTLPYKH